MLKMMREMKSDHDIVEIYINFIRIYLFHFALEGTPLHWAAGKGRSEAIKFLVERGSKIDLVSSQGLTAVLMAAVSSSLPLYPFSSLYSIYLLQCFPVRLLRYLHFPSILSLLIDVYILVFYWQSYFWQSAP